MGDCSARRPRSRQSPIQVRSRNSAAPRKRPDPRLRLPPLPPGLHSGRPGANRWRRGRSGHPSPAARPWSWTTGSCEPECGIEGLGSGGVGVVLLEVVTLHDAELDLVVLQGLSEQPPAHSGFAQARSAAEAQPHRECVVGCSAVSPVRIPVDRVHLQEWLGGGREGVVLVPRHNAPTAPDAVRFEGTMSAGLSVTREASPRMNRFTPVMGSSTVAPISFHKRPRPVARVSRTSQALLVKHLAERDAAQCRVDEVVQRRVVRLAVILPGGAAEGCHGR